MTSSPQGQPGTGWTVDSASEASEVSPSNQIIQGYRVYFTTQYQQHGSVFVPREAYSETRVREYINAQAATMDAVHMLKG